MSLTEAPPPPGFLTQDSPEKKPSILGAKGAHGDNGHAWEPPTSLELDKVEAKKVTEEEDDEEKKKKKEEEEKWKEKFPPVGVFQVFRHSTCRDRFFMTLGLLAAFAAGCGLPAMVILLGGILNAMVAQGRGDAGFEEVVRERLGEGCFNATNSLFPNCIAAYEALVPPSDFLTEIETFGIGVSVIGAIMWVLSYIFVSCLNYAAEKQVFLIRTLFLKAVLRQDISWYDTHQTGDFASRMAEDLNKLQEGIGEKVGMLVFFLSVFFLSIITAFIHGWELTLVIFAAMPLLAIAAAAMAKATTALTERELEAYGKAGAVAEEVLGSIRTVVAFDGQEKEVERYEKNLVFARKSGILRALVTGVSAGILWLIIFSSYALAFWFGIKLIMDDQEDCIADPSDCNQRYDAKALLVVFFSVLMGAMQVGQSSTYFEAYSVARSAAGAVFAIIDRVPEIDSASEEGTKPEKLSGDIEFWNVCFNYPSRPDVKILKKVSFSVKSGQTVALVGGSGSGKSTAVQLVQRFYDPLEGHVTVDGHDVKDLNLGWLRSNIGVVGQEPILFGCSIKENILYGKEDATDEEIEQAVRDANAADFISKLPKRLNTLVGERGAQLSGGQKQRVAIARALVRNPKILLLDEATSALDMESESVVQAALDRARQGRTTIVVAHRLSTIRTADMIVALKHGEVEEVGTHEKLMEQKGYYHSLVTKQLKGPVADDGADDSGAGTSMEDINTSVEELTAERETKPPRSATKKRPELVKQDRVKSGDSRKDAVAETETETEAPPVSHFRLWAMNKPEWPFILVGILCSIVMGAVMPIFGILFGDVVGVIGYSDFQKARDESVIYALYFVALGVGSGLAMFFQAFMFGVSGEKLTMRMRRVTFEAMLRQEMSWYDKEANKTGALCARLSGDASKIQGATGTRVGTVIQSLFTLLIALGVSLYYSWNLALVTALFVPIIVLGVYLETKIVSGHDSVEKQAFEISANIAIEAISNIRTVAGLRSEDKFSRLYEEELEAPHKKTLRKSHIRGFVFGFSQAAPFFAYAVVMFYGGWLIKEGELTYDKVFKVAESLILGAFVIGQSVAFAPDYNKAITASRRIFQLLDRKSEIDSSDRETGKKPPPLAGNVSFSSANFCYPSRPDVQVLNDMQLSLASGQNIALVGESGCGKSTTIQLLQRFYDLRSGELNVDGENIESLNVPFLRSQLGIVSQEPVLFDRTIAENIQYGDNSRTVPMEEVISAARRANIHNFIAALPLGYETKVGERGTQLSGGQKQRVAIARALVRSPRVLLLDEATSALDTESEKIVQDALDRAQEGTTSITIAHRLSTVRDADKIFVFDGGRVAESGSHDELLRKEGGKYAKLWNSQVE